MKITRGLFQGQVLQRDSKNKASARIEGTSLSEGMVELRVMANKKSLPGHEWKVVGSNEQKKFSVQISNMKIGGPYNVELRIKKNKKTLDSLIITDIYVGDVWVCAGQSNMEGVGNLKDAPKPNPNVRAMYMNDEWKEAKNKIHFLEEAIDTFHNDYGDGPNRPSKKDLEKARGLLIKGLSSANSFGLEMLERTKVPQGLIACAHGGTSMAQWSPKLKNKGGASLYGAMMRRFEKCNQPIAGVIWYQGESDANANDAKIYTKNMIELISSSREDMKQPKLPWLIVQLGCHIAINNGKWNEIQEQQRLLPNKITYLDVAPAIDLELDDGIHIGGNGQNKLGKRLARLADNLVHKRKGVKGSITIDKIELIKCPGSVSKAIKISYKNVVGKLSSLGLPTGFVTLDSNNKVTPSIYKTILEKNAVILHTNFNGSILETLSISYGHSRYSYCNIVDEDGMSIPVMQALPINVFHGPFCLNWKTSYIKDAKTLSKVSFTQLSAIKNWKNAPLRNCAPLLGLGVVPKSPSDSQTGLYAMKTDLTASEAITIPLYFGANIPFKIWLNGKPILNDNNCTAPISLDDYDLLLKLKKGLNTIVVAVNLKTAEARLGICAKLKGVKELAQVKIKV